MSKIVGGFAVVIMSVALAIFLAGYYHHWEAKVFLPISGTLVQLAGTFYVASGIANALPAKAQGLMAKLTKLFPPTPTAMVIGCVYAAMGALLQIFGGLAG